MEVLLLVEADATAVEHEEDCLVQDSSLMRCPMAGFRVADGDEISDHWNLLERDTPVKRDELSFDSEEGAAKEQMARKDTTGAGGHCWDGAAGRQRQWEEGRRRHDWAAGSSRDGGERVVARDGAGCGVGSDPFTATHAVAELTMGAAGD
ncbi:hypothetical protein BHM03_00042973 [Ensete ventricosum]|nr:hypothetical protein BHM03_00042973 [Ensete ventricosum]